MAVVGSALLAATLKHRRFASLANASLAAQQGHAVIQFRSFQVGKAFARAISKCLETQAMATLITPLPVCLMRVLHN
jgi:glycerol-3-phosphate acyltransferase PlsY